LCIFCDENFYRFEVLRKKELRLIKKSPKKHEISNVPFWDRWWYSADFIVMQKITQFRQFDFNAEEGYQEFVDACDNYWEKLSIEERKAIWKENK
jgi:hypothetical protein